jgi:RHS repeat-associated protein
MRNTASSLRSSRTCTKHCCNSRRRSTRARSETKPSQLGSSCGFLTQKELDPDAVAFNSQNNRYHFPFRLYLPSRGVFGQIDTLVRTRTVDLIRYYTSIELYAYVQSRPTTWVDPLGLKAVCCQGTDSKGNPRSEDNCFVICNYSGDITNPYGHTSFGPSFSKQVGYYPNGWHNDATKERFESVSKCWTCCCLSDQELQQIVANYDKAMKAATPGDYPDNKPYPTGPSSAPWKATKNNCASSAASCTGGLGAPNLPPTLPGNNFDTPDDLAQILSKNKFCTTE